MAPYPVAAVRGNVAKGCWPFGPKYTISGYAYDANGTTAVSGATIAFGALSTTSAGDGSYTLAGVPKGSSGSMTCTLAGYSWTAISIAAMSANLTSQNYTNAQWAAGGCAALCVGAWNPMGAADYAASKTTLAGSATCVDGAAFPTWDAVNGWKFAKASTQYLVTDLVPSGNQTWSMLVRFSNGDGATAYEALAGCQSAATFFWILPTSSPNANTHATGNGSTVALTNNPEYTTGRLALCGRKFYADGSLIDTLAAGTGTQTYAMYIGARNNVGSADIPVEAYIQKIWIYNADVSSYIASLDAALGT